MSHKYVFGIAGDNSVCAVMTLAYCQENRSAQWSNAEKIDWFCSRMKTSENVCVCKMCGGCSSCAFDGEYFDALDRLHGFLSADLVAFDSFTQMVAAMMFADDIAWIEYDTAIKNIYPKSTPKDHARLRQQQDEFIQQLKQIHVPIRDYDDFSTWDELSDTDKTKYRVAADEFIHQLTEKVDALKRELGIK